MRAVHATRYVVPLREGGSLPGIVEADDDGIYVVKFHGAGQGVKVLVAEVIVAELARALRIPVPELVTIEMPAAIARYEADEEVQDLLNASPGINLGVDFLPGSFGYDGSRAPAADLAEAIVWLDAFTANVDRTWSNPNLLLWHREVWAIDHGAALYFHHAWPSRGADAARFAAQPFDASAHVLRDAVGTPQSGPVGTPQADPGPGLAAVAARHEEFAGRLTDEVLIEVLAAVPDYWLEPAPGLADPAAVRAAYIEHLRLRRDTPAAWLPGRTP